MLPEFIYFSRPERSEAVEHIHTVITSESVTPTKLAGEEEGQKKMPFPQSPSALGYSAEWATWCGFGRCRT
jgi:DNA-binding protein H-NS